MKDWYRINDEQFEKLSKHVSTLDLIKSAPLFYAQDNPVSKLNLMRYLDDHGPEQTEEKHYLIYEAVFESMDSHDKVDVMKYIQYLEEGEDGNVEI